MTTYIVTVTVQFPAHDERDGITFTVKAESKAKAIKEAREMNRSGGQVHSEQGRAVWSAAEAPEGTTADESAGPSEEDFARWAREYREQQEAWL